jgi:glucan 1,3-beta-glucosidase
VLDRRFGYAERERLYTLFRDHWITERDWDLLPQLNLNLVRLPFIYSVVEDEQPRQLRADAWKYLDRHDEAEQRGIYVILDLHGAVGSQGWEHHSGCAGKISTGTRRNTSSAPSGCGSRSPRATRIAARWPATAS